MRPGIPLSASIARLVQRIVLDRENFQLPTLPPAIGGMWGDLPLDGFWGPLSIDGPELVWEVNITHGATESAARRLERIEGLRNQPASLHLADGTRALAKFGHWKRWGGRVGMRPGYTCEFTVWNIDGPHASRWVGKLRGGGFLKANLGVSSADRLSAHHMRLEGRYVWHILDCNKESETFDVIIDAGPSPLDQAALGTDFDALQFAFGAPMQLDCIRCTAHVSLT